MNKSTRCGDRMREWENAIIMSYGDDTTLNVNICVSPPDVALRDYRICCHAVRREYHIGRDGRSDSTDVMV